MSAVITGVVKLTFGLLSKKVLSYSARKLQNGGLADKEFRNLIIGELDDIKYKLDAYALRELKNGFSCLKRGVERLNMCFSDSVDGISNSSDPITGIEQVLAHAHPVGKLRGIANRRYELAEESFRDAARDAGLAFHNDALSIEDRILACKVRIASGILQNLADPELAARDCLGYLEELHARKEIFDIFKVYDNGGFRAFIKKDSRARAVESVIAINLFLLNFITTFASKEKALNIFEWPLIEHDTDTNVYHPIYFEFTMNEPTGILPPWCIRVLLHYKGISAVNSKGDIILCRRYNTTCFLAKLERETCKLKQLDIPALDKKGKDEDIKCNYLAVDEDDIVYLLTRYGQENHYDLFVCDSNANDIHHYPITFLKGKECRCFGITKDKRLVFCCEFEQNNHLYICDRNGQLEKDFPAVRIPHNQVVKDILSPSSNEIKLVALKKEDKSSSTIFLYDYSVTGHSLQPIKLRLPAGSKFPSSCTVRYDYLKNNFICLASTTTFRVWKYLQFTKTGELRRSCDLNMYIKQLGFNKPNLSSHPKGNVALICQNGALFMQ